MHFIRLCFFASIIVFSGCGRSMSETWEDMKTASRYMGRGVDALCGKDNYESRMLDSDDDFIGPYDNDFVPLKKEDLHGLVAAADTPLSQPRGMPGQKGIPAIADFYSPPSTLGALFRTVHFNTDEHTVRDQEEVQALIHIARFLKKNPSVYLVAEGHADERASSSYNMALAMRRSNFIRSFLVKNGADQDRVYTVSYGKERPIAMGHTSDQWKINRRSEFKIYQK